MGYLSDLNINITALRITTGEKLNKLWGNIGDKSQLITSNKTSLVNAINEVKNTSLSSDDARIANWNTAYNRGDFREYGLGRASSISGLDLNLSTETSLRGFGSLEENRPYDYGTLLHIKGTNPANYTQLVMPVQSAVGNRKMRYRGITGVNIHPWVTLWDSKDFSTEDVASWRVAASIGDFRDFGLGRLMSRNKSVDTMSELESGLYGSISSDSGSPIPGSTGAFLHMRSATSGNTNWTQLYLLGNNAAEPRAFISHGSDTRKADWRELWTTGNLPNVVTKVTIGGSSNYGMRFTTSNNLSNSELVQTYLGTKVIDSRSTQSSLPANGANYVPKTQEIPNSTSFAYFHYIGNRYYSSLISKGWANDYASWKISGWAEGASTDAMRDFYLSHTIADGSWGPNYLIYHSGNVSEIKNSLSLDTSYYKLAKSVTDMVGGYHASFSNVDANVVTTNVSMYPSANSTNLMKTHSHLHSFGVNASYSWQLNKMSEGRDLYIRTNINRNWTEWDKFWTSGNLINPATQDWVNSQGFVTSVNSYTASNGIVISTSNNITPTYGTSANTIAQGNDSRINNGQIAFDRGDFRTYGLGTNPVDVSNINQIGVNARFYRMLSIEGNPLGAGAYLNMPYQGGQTMMFKVHQNGITVGSINNSSVITKHYDVWTSINFSKENYYTKNESLDLFVGLANTQTIGGTKTFSNSPIVPNATLASHAINKGQMESWVSSQGYSTQTLTAGTNIQISANNVISATNTTYSAGTLALLNTGTDTANRVWKTRDLADYVISKIAEGADSIWEHTSGGGIRIANYDSLATRDGSIAFGRGSGATKFNAIALGTSSNSDGNDGLVIGPLSSNLGAYGTVVGPYSSNTPMEGTVIGAFLLNNQRGCVVSGRYNDPILSTTTNTVTDDSPLFIIGNGKSASIRSNAYVMKSNGKGEFANVQSYKTQHSFGDMDIPNWKYIQDNLSVDGNGSEDWVSEYGSQISVFNGGIASENLETSPYNSSGEILSRQEIVNFDKPTLVYLSSSGAWRKWDDASNFENTYLTQTSALGIAVNKNTVLIKGYFPRGLSKELDELLLGLGTGQIFHCISKGALEYTEYTGNVDRVFGYTVNDKIAYFNPWMF